VVGLVVGPVVGVVAMVISRVAWRPGPLTAPVGLLVAVVYSVGYVWVLRAVDHRAGFAGCAGWCAAEVGSLVWNPGGDLLLAADGFGWWFLLLGTVGVVGAAIFGDR
jgi:formate hydrogenlyase subunit 3/multisubunit Na+/H+ antiporter MnhD subunit